MFTISSKLCLSGKKWEWARVDAQAGLDLCACEHSIEVHACDEMFGMLWCTLTRAHMEMNEWKKAKKSCSLGLQYIDDSVEETQYAVKVLRMYKKDINDQIDAYNASPISSIAEFRVNKVHNENDDLLFAYTSKIERDENPTQPELLIVDLDVNISRTLWKEIFDTINEQKLRSWTQTPLIAHETISLPSTNHWLTAIPILSSEDASVLKKHLMRDSVDSSTVVIIKVEEASGPPDFDTTAYIRAVTENAAHCERMYGEGHKLAV